MCMFPSPERTTRDGVEANGRERAGRRPTRLLCSGRLFLLVTRRGSRTGSPLGPLGPEGNTGKKGVRPPRQPRTRWTLLQSRESGDHETETDGAQDGRCTQDGAKEFAVCGREERCLRSRLRNAMITTLSTMRWWEGAAGRLARSKSCHCIQTVSIAQECALVRSMIITHEYKKSSLDRSV